MMRADVSSPLAAEIRSVGSRYGGATFVPMGAGATNDDELFCRRSLSRHPGLPCWAWLSPTLPWRRRPRLSRHAPPMRRSATLSPRTPITWRDWTGIPICGRCIGMRHCACWIPAWYSAWVACYACQCRGSSQAATSRRVCSPVISGRRNGSPLWAFRRNGCRHWWHGTVWHRRPISIRRPGSNLTPSRSRRWSRSSARTRRDLSSSRSARPARNFLPPLLVLEAARPEPVCASEPVWNISPVRAGARRGSYAGWGWNGCSGWRAIHAGCSDVT